MLNHMTMQPRIWQAIERLNYLFLHKDKFECVWIPAMICSMKLTVELSIEILQINTTFFIDDQLYVVMCFTALMTISFIDQLYYDSIHPPIKKQFESDEVGL